MSIGRLRHRVTIQAPPSGRGSRGQKTGSPTDVATVAAEVRTLSGQERVEARKLYALASLEVRIRHYTGLTTKHRLKFKGRLLGIGAIDNLDERDRWNVLLCAEER